MTTNLNWQQALKEFNSRRKEEGGKHIIPKKGTEDYVAVRKLMGDTDAKSMVPDQPVKEQIKPKRSNSKTKTLAPSQIKELVEGDLPTLEKPLWVDEPKAPEPKKKVKKTKVEVEDTQTQTDNKILEVEGAKPNKTVKVVKVKREV